MKFNLLSKEGCDDSRQNSHVETIHNGQGHQGGMGLGWSEVHGIAELNF